MNDCLRGYQWFGVVSKIYGTIYDTYFNLLPMSVKELVL